MAVGRFGVGVGVGWVFCWFSVGVAGQHISVIKAMVFIDIPGFFYLLMRMRACARASVALRI
jgi:hypothetical protein